jgi:hypothetical protein
MGMNNSDAEVRAAGGKVCCCMHFHRTLSSLAWQRALLQCFDVALSCKFIAWGFTGR